MLKQILSMCHVLKNASLFPLPHPFLRTIQMNVPELCDVNDYELKHFLLAIGKII